MKTKKLKEKLGLTVKEAENISANFGCDNIVNKEVVWDFTENLEELVRITQKKLSSYEKLKKENKFLKKENMQLLKNSDRFNMEFDVEQERSNL